MNLSVRVTASLDGLAARVRAAAHARRPGGGDGAADIALPSTSNLRDPAAMAALRSFDEPPSDPT